MKVVFTPDTKNTVMHSMSQAICIARGGIPVEYIDIEDHKKKIVTMGELVHLNLTTKNNRLEEVVNARHIAREARHEIVQIQVNINDVVVTVNAKTTVEQAMDQFCKKINQNAHVAHKEAKKTPHAQHTKD